MTRGVSSDPAKEAARREKIRVSMRELAKLRVRNEDTGRWSRAPVSVSFGFVRVGREGRMHRENRRLGWDYDFVDAEDIPDYGIDDEETLRKHLEAESVRKGTPRRYWVIRSG